MKKKTNLTKLYLLVITLPKGKKEIIGDMLAKYDVTAYLSTIAKGAIDKTFTKDLMFCIVREDQIKDAMLHIEDKFNKFKSNISMAYAIPIDSIIGVSSYMAMSNGGR